MRPASHPEISRAPSHQPQTSPRAEQLLAPELDHDEEVVDEGSPTEDAEEDLLERAIRAHQEFEDDEEEEQIVYPRCVLLVSTRCMRLRKNTDQQCLPY